MYIGNFTRTYVGLDVLVLEVESVLPNVDTDDRNEAQERILVGGGRELQTLGSGVIPEPAPAGALDGRSGGVELLLEGIEGAPLLDDGLLEGAVAEGAAVALALRRGGREVLPEERVVDVPCGAAASIARRA